MNGTHCLRCGRNLQLVGRAHRCLPSVANGPDGSAAKVGMANSRDVANGDSTTYRYRDPGTRRAYMRELMRRRREAERHPE